VVNAAGRDLGAYTMNSRLSLEQAYRRINPVPKPPAMMDFRSPPASSSTQTTQQTLATPHQAPGSSIEDELFRDCGVTMTPEIREKLEALSGKKRTVDEAGLSNADSSQDNVKRARTNVEDDLDYTRHQFNDMLRDSSVTAEFMRENFCPICGFGGLTGEAPVHANAYNTVNEMCKAAIQGDKRTHAFIISEFWNSNLYRPMYRLGKRILPLTFEMAYHHLTEPHRMEANNDLQNDIRSVDMKKTILDSMIFQLNPLTGNLMYDPKAFAMSMACMRSKNILRKTQPDKMAFANPNDRHLSDLIAQNVNPYRNVSLEAVAANSAPGVRRDTTSKTKTAMLGGRRH
jgi:hypothetical protein